MATRTIFVWPDGTWTDKENLESWKSDDVQRFSLPDTMSDEEVEEYIFNFNYPKE